MTDSCEASRSGLIDLRSDTLTLPTPGMREAMMGAEVGDAYYDEDPSVRALESRVADLFGKPAALFMPSGTMSNQIALKLHGRPGDAVLVHPDNHIVQYESGALAGIAQLQHMTVPVVDGFVVDADRLVEVVSPLSATHAAHTRVVSVENTHLKSGGRVYPLEALRHLREAAHTLGLAVHLDGARIWHAHVTEGMPLAAYGDTADTISVCFSKGLGAPVGSCLLGSVEHIALAKRLRKMQGGSMRQCGFLAAAASYAIEHNIRRLAEDHLAARRLAAFLRTRFPEAHVPEPETNIVLMQLPDASTLSSSAGDLWTPARVLAQLEAEHGLRMSALGPRLLRAVTHLSAPLPSSLERR